MSPSMKNVAIALALASTAAAKQVGCFGDSGSLKLEDKFRFQSPGHCIDACRASGKSFAALTGGNTCFCGNEVPTSDKLPDSDCGKVCSGYPAETCGGENAWQVLSIGEEDSSVRSSSNRRDDDPTGEDQDNDADDADDNADDTDGGKDDSDPTGEDEVNDSDDGNDKDGNDKDGNDKDGNDKDDNDKDGDDSNSGGNSQGGNDNTANQSQSGTQAANEGPSATGSGSSPSETGAGSRLSAGGVASLLGIAAFAMSI